MKNTSITKSFMQPHVIVAGILVVGMAVSFWLASRYPSLISRLQEGGEVGLQGSLSFGSVMSSAPSDPFWYRVAVTLVNWIDANKYGMTFGVFFGAAILTLLSFVQHKRPNNPFMASLLGLVSGAPLGVCANCVAPIGTGLYKAGMRVETVLATMISSPTLNIVVIAMALAILPPTLVVIKIGLTFFLIFAVVPLLSVNEKVLPIVPSKPKVGGWKLALPGVVKQYGKDLGYIALRTVPLMFLAGLLGALAIEIAPVEKIAALPADPIAIVVISLLGTFLPVPIAFDVVFAYLLLHVGAPVPLAAALLVTLGSYSIYSMSIVGQSISWRVALYLFYAVVFTGIVAAALTYNMGGVFL